MLSLSGISTLFFNPFTFATPEIFIFELYSYSQ
jgi:hypothetical protein